MQRVDDDGSVLQRMAAGECGALDELYAHHRAPLLAYLRTLIGDRGLAEEVLQDTLFAAWTGADRFEQRSSVRAWLLGIAWRRAHDTLRRDSRHVVADVDLTNVPAPDPEPVSQVIAHADHAALGAALDRLSAAHREVLILNFVHELSYRDIATVLGIPIGTVMSRLHHAKRALRTTLEGDHPR